VAINAIERFLGDLGHEKGWRVHLPAETRKEKIAIIGSGPGGLSCAYYLSLQGYRPVIWEEKNEAGGMLRFGIPAYRLPKAVVDREVQQLKGMGVEFRFGQRLGKDFTLADLQKDYDALFVATGSPQSRPLNVPGENLPQVLHGLSFLQEVNLGRRPAIGRRVAVIGGGNTAIDAARAALRLGAEVSLVYRRSREEMPASPEEVEAAEKEGVKIEFLKAPIAFSPAKDGVVMKTVCMELGAPDETGRKRPIPIPGSELEMRFDRVLLAIGEIPDVSVLPPEIPKVDGRIAVDEQMSTRVPKVYSGGDVVTGPAFVSKAIGMGKRAAQAIDEHLRKVPAQPSRPIKVILLKDMNPDYFDPAKRTEVPHKPWSEARKDFSEVKGGLDAERAVYEASRCFHCAVPPVYDEKRCLGCSNCEQRCPHQAISMARRDDPFVVGVDLKTVDMAKVLEICKKAHFHPAQIICYCTETRAEEIAAAILKGARNPAEIGAMTGATSGCSVECIQPILRILEAAGIDPGKAQGTQWYGRTPTAWEVPREVAENPQYRKFHFQDDRKLMERLVAKEGRRVK
jgi:NADPH-dependent glutamate synthase beta subunit-like oxidoreductase/bacterioferritin-associated ferredoxin